MPKVYRDYRWAIEEYKNGAKLQDLAKRCGLTRVGMYYALKREGLTTLRDERVKIPEEAVAELYSQGTLMKDIAKIYNCTLPAVSLALKRYRTKVAQSSDPASEPISVDMIAQKPRAETSPRSCVRRRKKKGAVRHPEQVAAKNVPCSPINNLDTRNPFDTIEQTDSIWFDSTEIDLFIPTDESAYQEFQKDLLSAQPATGKKRSSKKDNADAIDREALKIQRVLDKKNRRGYTDKDLKKIISSLGKNFWSKCHITGEGEEQLAEGWLDENSCT